jgi:D-3-phosphoglycerate dehydrogenase
MIRILTNDGIEKSAAEKLARMGYEVVEKHADQEALKDMVQTIDVLTVRSATKVTKEIIDAARITGRLKLIIRGGVGIDNIDAVYARQHGIVVANTPNANSASVAELVMGHLFSLARHIGISNVTMRNGEWNKKQYMGIEIGGKTLGLIGSGRIAQETAKRADALGMTIIYTNRTGPKECFSTYKYYDLPELLKQSDFISIHMPFVKGMAPLIGTEEFELMKDGVFIVNTARGGIINEKALLKAIDSGKVAGAALDVFEEEPTTNKDLCACAKISMTPHIGGATKEAQERIGTEVVSIIEAFF